MQETFFFFFVLFKDVGANTNILQGAILHEDVVDDTDATKAIKFD